MGLELVGGAEVGVKTATIAVNTSTSSTLSIGGARRGTFQLPTAFTGANVAVQFSIDGSVFTAVPPMTWESNPQNVAANGTYSIPAKAFDAKFMQLVSGGTENAARSIPVFFRA